MLALSLFSGAGCKPAGDTVDKSDPVHIKIVLTDGREMKADLYPNVAPKSVENFVGLIEDDFFDGLIFHRVINGFMIQGGGYDESFYEGNFNQKEAEPIKGEFSSNGVTNNLKHTKGVLSMARTQVPDSGSSQFFIMHETSPHLDGEYAAFGEITEGIEIVDEIAQSETTTLSGELTYEGQVYKQNMSDVPKEPVVIKTIDIIE
ncbi:MAG: peptidylprolyl isomerase [Clostridia bacterium]|nr:peptidylprolyl isomerase [Clostridia bacterium]